MNALMEPLTEDEKSKLSVAVEVVLENKGALESTIEALTTIRNGRLYRDSHSSFDVFCEQTFGFTKRWANGLLAGEAAIKELESGNYSSHRLTPANIDVLRGASAKAKLELAKIPLKKRVKVVENVLRNGTPTQKSIIEAVKVVEHRKLERVHSVLIAMDNEYESIKMLLACTTIPANRIYERLRKAVENVL